MQLVERAADLLQKCGFTDAVTADETDDSVITISNEIEEGPKNRLVRVLKVRVLRHQLEMISISRGFRLSILEKSVEYSKIPFA
jgi:hypothetical protein